MARGFGDLRIFWIMEWIFGIVECLVDLDLIRLLLEGGEGGCWLGEGGGDCEA